MQQEVLLLVLALDGMENTKLQGLACDSYHAVTEMTLLKHKFDMKALFSFEISACILDCRSESPHPAVHGDSSPRAAITQKTSTFPRPRP